MAAWVEIARAYAPVALISGPFLGAAIAVLAPNGRWAWLIGAIAMLACAALALDFAAHAAPSDMGERYLPDTLSLAALRNAGLGLDGVGLFALPVLSVGGALAMIASGSGRDLNAPASVFRIALTLCMIGAWSAAVAARDLLGLTIAAQAGWLASVGLAAMAGERDGASLAGAMRMLTTGAVAGALMLVGCGAIAAAVGDLDLGALAHARVAATQMAALGAALIVAGLTAMAGLAPLGWWIGAGYARVGGLDALAFSAVGAVGALACIIRFAAGALQAPSLAGGVGAGLAALGAAGVIIASIQALGAGNVRRLGAYAGAAQAGCLFLGLAVGSPAGLAASLLQLLAIAAAMLGFYAGAAVLGADTRFSALDGRGRRAPLEGAALALGCLSLMGAPLTLGFLARWRLLEALMISQWWWAAVVVVAATLASIFYCGRVIERIYFRRATVTAAPSGAWRAFVSAPALLSAIAALLIGVGPRRLIDAAERCASWLMGQAA